ncbi:MAG TPA: IPTL-CTERM sorting domain-containing protein [Xanthomonadales bacterium]|nr:IPTL-CTERM sorting domain-containing protein [Xanthomonadales bacterium]
MIGTLNRRWLAIAAATTCALGVLCGPAALAAAKSQAALEFAPAEVSTDVKGQTAARPSTPALPSVYAPAAPLGQGYAGEVEPNGSFATASPLGATNVVARANLFPNGDVDFYSFTANAGDRVYAATMTSFSAGSSTDSQLTLLASDGTTVIEFDDDNGTFAGLSSSIAGATIPANGTYFIKINDFTAGTTSERPYELHLRVQSGTPTPEVEGNDTPAAANALPANGWVSGTRDPALATEQDWFSFTANAGDTVYLSLDVNPERDGVVWNGRLGMGLFGDAANQILVVDDSGTGDTAPNPVNPSEAFFLTVKSAGTYYAFVDSATAAVGGPTATYNLSVSVHPAANEGVNCTTYTSTDAPQAIGPGTGLTSSTITIPGNPRIADVDVSIVLNHALMGDIDAHLRSPAGNDNGLFTDIGASAIGGQNQMDVTFDDEAGTPPAFTVLKGVQIKPELNYRLSWFDGENAGGTWTLDLRDDTTGTNGGTLTSWSMRVCEAPPPPTCAAGFVATTVYTTDFEAGAAGFTHSGTGDQWALGLPAAAATTTTNPLAAFTTCNSGSSCWKTNLTGTYNASTTHDLLSPNINLAGLSPPVVVTWAQRYQMESASFDHLFVDAQQAGGATPVRLFEHLDATMTNAPGNPAVNTGASAGWSLKSARVDSLAGLNSELRFHVDTDSSINFQGLAVDDVSVTACRALSADLSITKTDGAVNAVPGTTTTYTITASNPPGGDPVPAATITDTFPAACVGVTWTCTGAGGGTCTANGSGNINSSANLPAGGSVTYVAQCPISPAATGTLVNTASVSGGVVTDPTPANNSATDTDTLTPQADLSITKTNGTATVGAGSNTIYTIVASNAGPSAAPASTVADTFPAACTSVNWTCSGAGGGTCTAAGAGNINQSVNLPAGGSVTFLATCAVNAAAVGNLVNTATVAVAGGITDPTPANNSATDTDTIVNNQADIAITKTDGQTTDIPGTSITYTIAVSNAGPGGAASVTVADTFPATLTGVTWTCVGAVGGTCVANGSGNLNSVANLPAGGSVTYTVNATIAANASGTLSNTATATAGGGVIDPVPGNNSATDTTTLTAQSDLSITLTDTPDPVTAGTNLTYLATLTNGGASDAQDVTITLPLPAGTSFVSVGSSAGGTCNAVSPVVCTWTGATAPASARTASIVVAVAAAQTASLSATAAASSTTTDPVPGNNTATATTAVQVQADLAVTLTDAPDPVVAGTQLTYTAIISNSGPSDATGVSLSLPLPTGTSLVSGTVSGGGSCAGSPVVCTVTGSIVPAGSRTVTVVVLVAASVLDGTVLNATATVTAASPDPNAANNSASTTTAVIAQADLLLTFTGSTTQAAINVPVTFTADSLNQGPSDAQDVIVTITLTPDFRYGGHTATGATCTTPQIGNTGAIVCTWAGATAPGVTRTLVLTAFSNTEGQTAVSASTTSSTTDPTPNNNFGNLTVQVGYLVEEIPTLSSLGLILMGLLFGLMGFVAVRRQG